MHRKGGKKLVKNLRPQKQVEFNTKFEELFDLALDIKDDFVAETVKKEDDTHSNLRNYSFFEDLKFWMNQLIVEANFLEAKCNISRLTGVLGVFRNLTIFRNNCKCPLSPQKRVHYTCSHRTQFSRDDLPEVLYFTSRMSSSTMSRLHTKRFWLTVTRFSPVWLSCQREWDPVKLKENFRRRPAAVDTEICIRCPDGLDGRTVLRSLTEQRTQWQKCHCGSNLNWQICVGWLISKGWIPSLTNRRPGGDFVTRIQNSFSGTMAEDQLAFDSDEDLSDISLGDDTDSHLGYVIESNYLCALCQELCLHAMSSDYAQFDAVLFWDGDILFSHNGEHWVFCHECRRFYHLKCIKPNFVPQDIAGTSFVCCWRKQCSSG